MSKHSHHRAIQAHSKNVPPSVSATTMLDQYIRPALLQIGLADPASTQLLLGTAAIESRFTYLTQMFNGPARGYWQMEDKTHVWLWESFLTQKKTLS